MGRPAPGRAPHFDFFSGAVSANRDYRGFVTGIDCDKETPGTVRNKGFSLCFAQL